MERRQVRLIFFVRAKTLCLLEVPRLTLLSLAFAGRRAEVICKVDAAIALRETASGKACRTCPRESATRLVP